MTEPTGKKPTAREMADNLIAAMRAAAGKKEVPSKDIDEGMGFFLYNELDHLLQLINDFLNSKSEHIKTADRMLEIIKGNPYSLLRDFPKQTGWDDRTKAFWDTWDQLHTLMKSYNAEGQKGSTKKQTIKAAREIIKAALEA